MSAPKEIEAAAAAIANARGGRRGAPAISNIIEVLQKISGGKLYREAMEDAEAALDAAEKVREPVVFTTNTDPPLRCTVNGPAHIVVAKVEGDA